MTDPQKTDMNPYATPQRTSDEPSVQTMARPMATLVAFFLCGSVAMVTGFVLALIVLIRPLARVLHFDGEFDGLIIFGLPPMAGGCGALAGIALGLFLGHKKSVPIAAATGMLPALVLYSRTWDSHLTSPWEDSPVPAIIIPLAMALASTVAAVAGHRALSAINHRRFDGVTAAPFAKPNSQGYVAVGVAVIANTLSLICLSALWTAARSGRSPETVIAITFVVSILAVAVSLYLFAGHRARRRLAIVCLVHSAAALLIALFLFQFHWQLFI